MEITLQGNLKSFRLPDVLSFLNLSRRSGTLNVQSTGKETFIYFENGGVIYAASNQEKFRLSSIMLQQKVIDSAQWKRLEKRMVEAREKFGEVAVREKLITEEQLKQLLKVQVSEIVYDCFTWAEGKFSFLDVLQLPDYAVTIAIDLPNLIMEAARRIDEWHECLSLFPRKGMIFRVQEAPEIQERIVLTLEEWKILFLIDGKRTLEDVRQMSELDALKVYRVVYGLMANKLIEEVPQVDEPTEQEPEPGKPAPAFNSDQRETAVIKDTELLVSPEANLSYRDVLKVTMARLTMKRPENQLFPLVEQEYTVGRQPGSQIQLNDHGVSATHARIFRGPEGYVLEDLKSRNGSFVNDQRVERKLLQDNDRIQIGNTTLLYNVVEEVKRVSNA